MKTLKILFSVLSVSLFLGSCQSEQFNDKYDDTTVWYGPYEQATGVTPTPPTINCSPQGNTCDIGTFSNYLANGVQQTYVYWLDQLGGTGNNRISSESEVTYSIQEKIIKLKNIDLRSPKIQAGLFLYYKYHQNVMDYFKTQNWQVLFPDIASNKDLNQIVSNGSFDIKFVENDESVLFVKDKDGGYTVDNVLYAFKTDYKLKR